MDKRILSVLAACGVAAVIAFSSAPAYAKTVKECDAEYAANKEAIKASGQKKADYVATCRAAAAAPVATPAAAAPAASAPAPAAAPAATPAVAATKTVKECDAEYAANKEAIKASGQKKADYVAACRAGAAAPVATPAAAAPAAPAPAAPAATPTMAAPPPMAPAAAPAKPRVAAPTGAGGFTADTQAKAHCPTDTVVWVNTKSGIYHFAGTHNYGTTKEGTYMCEADAKAAGDRAAENEKHP